MLVVIAPKAPLEVRLGFGGFGSCLSGFAAIMLWRNWMHVFLQESGIREYRQRRSRSLRYDQVDELLYTSLRIFGHGSYIHTVQKLALKSNRLAGPPLVCTLIFKEADGRSHAEAGTPLTKVRDRISSAIAARLFERLAREPTVDWTPEVRISKRGLELSNHRSVWKLVEWRKISRYEMEGGTLKLWIEGETTPRHQISTSQSNFYPAYSLALRLHSQAKV